MTSDSQDKGFEIVFQKLAELTLKDADIIIAPQNVREVIQSSASEVDELRMLAESHQLVAREEYFTGT